MLSALTPEHLPALVIAPKRVAETVWPVERELWRPDLSLTLVAGSAAQRKAALATPADITVIGRDVQGDALPHAGRFRTVVIDELSGYKSKSSVRWRSANKLTKDTAHVWGLTGTPIPNGYLDLWAQVFLLDRGERLGTTLGGYRSRYFTEGARLPSGIVTRYDLRSGADGRIRELIDDICLAMEGRIEMPPLTHNIIDLGLPRQAAATYQAMKSDLTADLSDLLGPVVTAANSATLSGKLSQISAGFIYHDDATGLYTPLHDAKVEALREVIDGTGGPVLVFYRFTAELEMLQAAVPGRAIDEPGVITDWNAGRVPVLYAHPASAGHGLNLQYGGHTAVWTSLPWSSEEWEQANARLFRQGQTQPVVIHILQASGTIDPHIHKVVLGKVDVQDALLEHLESVL